MESRSYACPRCKKGVKFISNLIRHINACKIPITLPSYQSSTLVLILEYNITNYPDLPSDNFKKDINLGVSNNGKEKTKLADINNNNKDIRLADINKQRPAIPSWRSQNRLLSELFSTFRKLTFRKSKFIAGTPVLDTQYKHPKT